MVWLLGGSPHNNQTQSQWLLCPQLLPDPLSEAHGTLSPAEASSFLGLLEHVLAMEMAPLGPAALLAVVRFLKRVVALGAGDPELLLTGQWEQLSQRVVSVASLVLEEQVADSWLSIREVRPAGLGGQRPGLWFQPSHQLVVSLWGSQHLALGSISASIGRSFSFVYLISLISTNNCT